MTNENTTDTVSPAELLENSKVVAEVLRMLNEVIEQQQRTIVTMIVDLISATISLVKDANTIAQADTGTDEKSMDDSSEDISKTLQNFASTSASATQSSLDTKKLKEAISSDNGIKSNIGQVLITTYKNTVSTQQQLNVTANAAITQGIAIIYSLITATKKPRN